MHPVSTNQIAFTLYFNGKDEYSLVRNSLERNRKAGGVVVILGVTFAIQGKHASLTT